MPNSIRSHRSSFSHAAFDLLTGENPGVMLNNGYVPSERSDFSNQGAPKHSIAASPKPNSALLSPLSIDPLTGYNSPTSSSPISALFSINATSNQTSSPAPVAPIGLVNLVNSPPSTNATKGPRQYIIQFKDSVSNISGQSQQLIRQHQGNLKYIYQNSFRGFAAELPDKAIQALRKQSSIVAIYEDVKVHVENSAPQTVKLQQTRSGKATTTQPAQSIPWGISHVGGVKTGTGKTAWVIDTGIDYTHPDLKVDTQRAKSFVSRRANDDNGHGTHVAGTIAALNNSIGVVGVAAGATVVPVKVLDQAGSGYLSDVIAGVDYVAQNGKAGDVANLSLGGGYYQPLNDAVLRAAAKGIKFALAAGNSTQDVAMTSPASTNGVNVFTISAIDSSNRLASFSNYGAGIDYAAPGVGINSTWMGGGYRTLSGTSMATPHVAGLLLLGNPGISGVVQNDRDAYPEGIAFGVV